MSLRLPTVRISLDYLEAFDYIRPLLQTKEALTLAAYDVAKQAALENVLYIEVRFAPELSMDQGLTVPETIDAVCEGLRQAQEEFGIVAKPWSVACASPIKNSHLVYPCRSQPSQGSGICRV